MTDETAALIDRVHALLEAPLETTPRSRARIEHMLTEGYARALEIEAERLRIERQITQLAGVLEDGPDEHRVLELATLARRRSRADGDLAHLRRALGTLRERLAAAAPASPCTTA